MVIGTETIEVEGVNELIAVTWYKPNVSKSVPAGFTLADSVLNKTGGILFPKDMDIDADKIDRLVKFREKNKNDDFNFSITRSDKLISVMKERLNSDFKRFITSRKGKQEFRKFMEKVEDLFESHFDDILDREDLILSLYRNRVIEELSNPDSRTPFYNSLINTSLIAIGIIQQAIQKGSKKFKSDDIVNAGKAGLMMGMGGAQIVNTFNEMSLEEQKIRFTDGNKNSTGVAASLGANDDVVQAIKYCVNHTDGNNEFTDKEESSAEYANICLVACLFNSQISGLFGNAATAKNVIDQLYVKATNNELPKVYVDALAQSLQFGFLFDFYYEIEKLNKACPYGKHGRAYPMKGFKSPVIYVCKGHLSKCRYFTASSKAVTIFKKIGDLEPNSYGRCEWLSSELIKFYDKFYEQIKEDTAAKGASNGE